MHYSVLDKLDLKFFISSINFINTFFNADDFYNEIKIKRKYVEYETEGS